MTRETRQLTAIEDQLSESDPLLADMFAVLMRQPTLKQGPVKERLSPWRPTAKAAVLKMALVIVMACMLVASMAVAVVAADRHDGSSHGAHSGVNWGAGIP